MRKVLKRKITVSAFILGLICAAAGASAAQNNQGDRAAPPSAVDVGSVLIRDARGNGYRGVSNQTGVAAESLREWYGAELELNPKLPFGHFVAANVIAKNHQGLAAQAILTGLRSGKTLAQVLSGEGWDKNKIKAERKRLKRELHGKADYAYKDSGRDWKF